MQRVTPDYVARLHAGYVAEVDVLGEDEPRYYVAGNRRGWMLMVADLVADAHVLQVRSRRYAPAIQYGKSTPTPIIAEDLGTTAGFLFSGEEFAADRTRRDEEGAA